MTRHLEAPPLHPLAWWVWALALAVAASRTTNPLLLALIIAAAGFVVAARRSETPWARSYPVLLRLGLALLAVRVVLFAVFAGSPGGHVLFTLPQVGLPGWLAGLRIGGPVTAEGVLAAGYDGLRLAAVLCCVGAANSLTNPRRLLKSLPGALFEVGVVITVALSAAPQAVAGLTRLRVARRLRGRPDRGWRALRGLLLPALEEALEGSVSLAAAMDARGFGRQGARSRRRRRASAVMTVTALTALLASSYGLLVAGAPTALGWPLALGGAGLLVAGLLTGARGGRTRYRPDRWRWQESLIASSAVAGAALLGTAPAAVLNPPTSPPALPQLSPWPLLAVMLFAAAGVLAPRIRRTAPAPAPTAGVPVPSLTARVGP